MTATATRWLWTGASAYGAAAALALLVRPGPRALLVPLAGPWAARVYGHG